MNEIKIRINFAKRTCVRTGVNLTEGDYNSTKIKFQFDKEDGIKFFEMKSPSNKIVYNDVIVDNEVVLVGEGEVTTKHNNVDYIKYKDGSENVYWYDKTNEKLFDDEWTEILEFDLDNYTKVIEQCSLFTETGDYIFEVSLYKNQSKLTSASGKLKVVPEQVIVDGETIELYTPIFENLLGDIVDAITEADNLNIRI